jgi:hypothetical protein
VSPGELTDAAGNLLHIAMWSLRREGLMEFEQLRPAVEEERVRVCPDPAPGRGSGRRSAASRAAPSTAPSSPARAALPSRSSKPENGLPPLKGRLFKKIVFTDMAAVESLRARHGELRAARGSYLDAEPELTSAVMSDSLRAVADAYSPDLGD